MVGALLQHPFSNSVLFFTVSMLRMKVVTSDALSGKQSSRLHHQALSYGRTSDFRAASVCPLVCFELPKMMSLNKNHAKVFAVRRRRAYMQSETYVLLEPGKDEVFVTEDELRSRLKGWLENWPGNVLPTDLARFRTIDDVVTHLLKSVCELEIDGEVGSIQWYQVRLE